jgi:hypothetical protein
VQKNHAKKGMQMTTKPVNTAGTPKVSSTAECAEVIINAVKQLRREAGIADSHPISLYVTDVQLIRSTLSEKEDYIREQINAVDVVRVNVKAGNPMPAHLPQVDVHTLDESPATIGIAEG